MKEKSGWFQAQMQPVVSLITIRIAVSDSGSKLNRKCQKRPGLEAVFSYVESCCLASVDWPTMTDCRQSVQTPMINDSSEIR